MIPTLHSEADARPRFEFYPVNSPTLQTVYVESSPFTIGRGEATELQLNSTSVSREHARLTRTPTGYCLCDLDSTNGTSVNGQPITKVTLRDGDAVSIADTELTFACSSMGRLQRMVTQPLANKKKMAPASSLPAEVAAHRALGEGLLWQVLPLCWLSLFDRLSGATCGSIVGLTAPTAEQLKSLDFAEKCSTAARVQLVAWRRAADQFAEGEAETMLYLRVDHLASLHDGMLDFLDFAGDGLSPGQQLGIVIPWEWTTQSPAAAKLCAELRARDIRLIFEDFSGGAGCVDALEQAPPDYLAIAPHVIRDVASQPRRLQRLEIVQSGCEAAGVRLVLPAAVTEEDERACGDVGVDFAIRELTCRAELSAATPMLALS